MLPLFAKSINQMFHFGTNHLTHCAAYSILLLVLTINKGKTMQLPSTTSERQLYFMQETFGSETFELIDLCSGNLDRAFRTTIRSRAVMIEAIMKIKRNYKLQTKKEK